MPLKVQLKKNKQKTLKKLTSTPEKGIEYAYFYVRWLENHTEIELKMKLNPRFLFVTEL